MKCPGCDTPIPAGANCCPMCGATIFSAQPVINNNPTHPHITEVHYHSHQTDMTLPKNSNGMNTRQLLGLIGSIVLFVGVFTPVVSAPIVGNMNYFQNGKGDGAIILVFACCSLALVLAKKYRLLWVTGLGSMAVMAFSFINFQMKMSDVKAKMETDLAGNPFRGLADMALQSVQIQWGWALLIVGAGLVIASASVREQ